MSIRSFFNGLAEKREAKNKYKALAAAIKAGDLGAVKQALADGANAGFFPGSTKKMPLALAMKAGDTEIFKTLLNTDGGMSSVGFWHYDFRPLTRGTENSIYFLPSLLYGAIEMKREDIALAMINSPFVDVESPGEMMCGGRTHRPTDAELNKVKKPLDLARMRGLNRLADAIEQKLKPVLAERASKQAVDLAAQAEEKRAEAEKLLREADMLAPRPQTPKQGFNL